MPALSPPATNKEAGDAIRRANRSATARNRDITVSANQPRGPPLSELLQWSIPQFCQLHGWSVSEFYEKRKQGLTPEELRIGNRVWITKEAAAAWRKARTEATEQFRPLLPAVAL